MIPFKPRAFVPTTNESNITLFYIIFLVTSNALKSDKLSSPSVKAIILLIAFGYFYY